MTKPRGRTDDMLIIRGVNVFPSQIETVLLNHGYPANYQIIVDRVRSTDTLDVQVEMTPEMFTDNMGEIERRQKELVDGLRSMLGLQGHPGGPQVHRPQRGQGRPRHRQAENLRRVQRYEHEADLRLCGK